MAGMYRRNISPNFSSPAMQAAASQGAGGAIPRGGVAVPQGQQQDSGMDVSRLGGLLGMMAKQKEQGAGVGEQGFQGGEAGPQAIMGQGDMTKQSGIGGIDYSGGMGGAMTGNTLGNGIPAGMGADPLAAAGPGMQALQGAPAMGAGVPSAGAGGAAQMFGQNGQFNPDMFKNMFANFGGFGGTGF